MNRLQVISDYSIHEKGGRRAVALQTKIYTKAVLLLYYCLHTWLRTAPYVFLRYLEIRLSKSLFEPLTCIMRHTLAFHFVLDSEALSGYAPFKSGCLAMLRHFKQA